MTGANFNLEMIDGRIRELSEELSELMLQKLSGDSPGLRDAIFRAMRKLDNFRESRELWVAVLKVYPNYDR